jgi:hypothetical protein
MTVRELVDSLNMLVEDGDVAADAPVRLFETYDEPDEYVVASIYFAAKGVNDPGHVKLMIGRADDLADTFIPDGWTKEKES